MLLPLLHGSRLLIIQRFCSARILLEQAITLGRESLHFSRVRVVRPGACLALLSALERWCRRPRWSRRSRCRLEVGRVRGLLCRRGRACRLWRRRPSIRLRRCRFVDLWRLRRGEHYVQRSLRAHRKSTAAWCSQVQRGTGQTGAPTLASSSCMKMLVFMSVPGAYARRPGACCW